MAPKVQVLPPILANQIAAGEVIERPSSVVKELLENALDAGARSIEVQIKGAGRGLIRVLDDGEGMSPEDARRAFLRHATSKIERAEDLRAIRTLGFRGEALPSIAAISRVTLITRPRGGGPEGTRVLIEGGKVRDISPAPSPEGTSVEVRDLFFNTPARLKFLKSPGTEISRIVEATTQAALSAPDLRLKLTHEGRVLLDLPPARDRGERVRRLLSGTEAKELFSLPLFEEGPGEIRVEGFCSPPPLTRASRSSQHVLVNGRYVRDRVILNALSEAYRNLLPTGRHPLAFLFIEMAPDALDVNVHPAKAEVRFQDGRQVFSAVRKGVLEGLVRAGASPALETPKGSTYSLKGHRMPAPSPARWSLPTRPLRRAVALAPREAPDEPLPLLAPGTPKNLLSEGRVLGQLHATYILLEHTRGMLLVDQHAAHERLLFARLKDRIEKGKVKGQGLLLSLPIDFSPEDAEVLSERLEDLKALGFHLEPFGPRSFLLREVPALLAHEDPESLLRDLLPSLREGRDKKLSELGEGLLEQMSCRGALKAGKTLNREEMEHLISECLELDLLFACPHGRPITLLLPKEEVERRFLRR